MIVRERIKVDIAPKKLRVESEPYVTFVGRNFVAVIDVLDIKTGREYFLIISAQSISQYLVRWQEENNGKLTHVEFWINKIGEERKAPFELELA